MRDRDLATGALVAQYKGNCSGRGRLCRLGADYLVAAQSNKDALHVWTWHKVCCLVLFVLFVCATRVCVCLIARAHA